MTGVCNCSKKVLSTKSELSVRVIVLVFFLAGNRKRDARMLMGRKRSQGQTVVKAKN